MEKKNTKDSSPEVKDLIINAIKEGKVDNVKKKVTSLNWYHYYDHSDNPLSLLNPEEEFNEEDLNLFVNRKEEMEIISSYIGQIKKNPDCIHLAIIGASGIGKHTTMKVISSILNENFPEIDFEFYNYQFLYNYKNSEGLSFKDVKKIHNRNVDLRIISCTGKNKWQFLKKMKDFKDNSKVIISIWNTSEYPKEEDILVDREIFLKNFNKNDIIDILEGRITRTITDTDDMTEYYENLRMLIIPKIAKFSKGNIKIAFKLFEAIHQEGRNLNQKSINLSIIESKIEDLLEIKNKKLTKKEMEIITYLIEKQNAKFITTPNLVEELTYNRTIAWTYLERLTEKKILRKVRHGKPSKYELNDIFLTYYEENMINKLIFSNK